MSETSASTSSSQSSATPTETATSTVTTPPAGTPIQAESTTSTITAEGSKIDGPILGGKDEAPKAEGDKKPDALAGAPEKYEPFKVPEGFTLDETVAKEAGDLFKGMNLTQDQAQQLVDFYTAKTEAAAKAPYEAWTTIQEQWKSEIKADPEIGGKLDQVKASVGKLYDALGDPKLVAGFKEAMEFTGAGNNPAFVKALYKLSQMVTEGGAVRGRGPVEVKSPGGAPASAAKAIYPNLG